MYNTHTQYAYYRQMTHAALIIQNSYRSYCENKRFKKSQNQSSSKLAIQNSQCLQNYYKHYQHEQQQQQHSNGSSGATSKEPSPSGPLKYVFWATNILIAVVIVEFFFEYFIDRRTYSQRTQNLAARKIQQFMRQSKMK